MRVRSKFIGRGVKGQAHLHNRYEICIIDRRRGLFCIIDRRRGQISIDLRMKASRTFQNEPNVYDVVKSWNGESHPNATSRLVSDPEPIPVKNNSYCRDNSVGWSRAVPKLRVS